MNFIPKGDLEGISGELVHGLSEPACVFDIEHWILIGANEAALDLWGLSADRLPLVLDAAMPALAGLRRMLATQDTQPARLTFWTEHGPLTRMCTFRCMPAAEMRAGAIVTWPPTAAAEASRPAGSAAEARRAPPAASPSDIAALRRIALRLRERPHPLEDLSVKAPAEAVLMAAHVAATSTEQEAVAKLAHELRTPLAAVIALAEIMADGHLGPLPNERYRAYIRDIRDSTRHALALIDGLLDHGAHGGQLDLVFTEVDLNEAVKTCLATIQPLSDKAGLTISALLPDGLPKVIADRRCIKQILLNLLTNSVKYAGAGASIAVASGFELAGPVWVEVADSGPGIPAEVIARSFGHGENGAKPSSVERVGLGLPLSFQLARANGARIEVDSTHGARVRLVFGKDRAIPT